MKIKFAGILHVCIVVAVLAVIAIGFMSCGEKSHLAEIVISPSDPSMAIGTTIQLTGQGVLSNGVTFFESYLTWTSSNTDLATVDSTGLVTAGSVTGVTTITATETDSHTNVSGSTSVTLCTINTITVTPTNPSMAINTEYQFTAIATLSTGTTTTQNVTSYMTWTTIPPDSTVATVGSTGLVTAGSTTTETVTIQATDSYTGVSGTTVLTVTDTALSSLAITDVNGVADAASVAVESTLQLTATGTYGDATTAVITSSMTWSSSDTTIADVETSTGIVTGKASSGSATITATDPITGVSGSITVNATN